jgi:hypothetical protein
LNFDDAVLADAPFLDNYAGGVTAGQPVAGASDRAGVHKLTVQLKRRQACLIIATGATDFDRRTVCRLS